ncbi:MAG: aldehyde dehydrogenase [Bacteroidales bacterium]
MDALSEKITHVIKQQREFFHSGATLEYEFRHGQLLKLKQVIQKYEKQICEALFADLNKSAEESYITEISMVLSEIDYLSRNLKRLMRPKRVMTPLTAMPGTGKVIAEPYGCVLIIAPWNYPFQLLMNPLVGAMAAGNTAVLKPSPQSANTSSIINRIIKEAFSERYIALFEGDIEVNQDLLANRFDYIFFTGGLKFGSYVAECAAKFLTPVTLELGGKSPCIVAPEANIALAAKRIVWGKMLNAGQTCIAPDYILVHESVRSELIKQLKINIVDHFGANPEVTPHYPRIISQNAVERLAELMKSSGTVLFGGNLNKENRYFSPTILADPDPQSRVMQEEIFGPILPILSYKTIQEAISMINSREKPLALYYFGGKEEAREVTRKTSSGGVCINDTILHVGNRNLPFGGVGQSGMGRYHGKHSFLTFSNLKGHHRSFTFADFKFRYAPYKLPEFLKRFL